MAVEPASMVLDMLADTIDALNKGRSADATVIEHLAQAIGAESAVSVYYDVDEDESFEVIATVPDEQTAHPLLDYVSHSAHELEGHHFTIAEADGLGHVVCVLIRPQDESTPPEGFGRIIALNRAEPYDDDTLRMLHRACRPLTVLWPRAAQAYAQERAASDDLNITERERQVLELLARGLLATSIASRLNLSPRTVHKHLGNIYRKLGVHDRLVAVGVARAHGLLPESATVSASARPAGGQHS
ncbi:MAG: helix-turn-helix transcriptional regulator [Propionicimonas sp.]|uniref:response regulator transcription factor n=1 Tax=Propionicimonas sp. TaxID=1955623 RepID=UPI002B1FF835|nr:helix-turn-helix transcriptional regulator [Propionicimonas sp.]MEA4943732.1 helix-turn-helix transcriptional regulator [Propionicimonas sp.]MEA5052734.1 helix-turn-helix transcriptional regulator [Propionicimonas sp.]MEA5118167.1 helix-turn-helix transcriptional regulator [Propionicimonas sp.]